MITVDLIDITNVKAEALINTANGIGVMGAGVAGAINKASNGIVGQEARELFFKNKSPFDQGDFYKTGPGDLSNNGVICVYHAVTMKYPGQPSSLVSVESSLRKILDQCLIDDIDSIAIPGLGIGIGGLDYISVANIMNKNIKKYESYMDIMVCDFNKNFINYFKEILK